MLLSDDLSLRVGLLIALAMALLFVLLMVCGGRILLVNASVVFWTLLLRTSEHDGFLGILLSLPVATVSPRSSLLNLVHLFAILLFFCSFHSHHNNLRFLLNLKTFRILESFWQCCRSSLSVWNRLSLGIVSFCQWIIYWFRKYCW